MAIPSVSDRSRLAWALLLALFVPATAAAQGLSLAAAQQRALERSRQLPAQDAAISASREMAVAAGQLPDPVLRVGIDNLPVSGPERFSLTNDFMTMRRIGVMQELTRSDKRHLRAERLERGANKAAAEKALIAAAIERDTALAWLDLYYARAMADVSENGRGQAELELTAAEGAYRGGRGSQGDVLAARSAIAMTQDRTSQLRRRVRNAETMLARWVGADQQLSLSGAPDIERVRLDPAALDTQLVHHPELAMLARQEEIAQSEVRLAQANRQADWSVEVAFQQRGPAYSNMVSVGLSVPLQWDRKDRQDREVAARRALAEQASDEREEALRSHVAQTRSMLDEWQDGRERLDRYRHEILPLANYRNTALLAAYRGGKASLPELLAARRNELDLSLQALQLEADTARVWAQLNFLTPTAINNRKESK